MDILVVDDSVELLDMVASLLEQHGYQVVTAENGRDALVYLNQATVLPDLIILNLVMPVMDGLTFRTQQLRDCRLAAIPVIATSGNPTLGAQATASGAVYLRLPFDIDALLHVVEQVGHSRGQTWEQDHRER